MKQLMNEKRNLENTINNKNKEIENLNLKVQQMTGFHKRAIDKLEEDLDHAKREHNNWLERQERETSEWHAERNELNQQIDKLNKNITDLKRQNQEREGKLNGTINKKGIEIADLKGTIQEL
jgi:predicted  nucleic acid-binding Zn-ribbon protein